MRTLVEGSVRRVLPCVAMLIALGCASEHINGAGDDVAPSSITLSAFTVSLAVDHALLLSADVRNANGVRVAGALVRWKSSDPTIVSATGPGGSLNAVSIAAIHPGLARITATIGVLSASAEVTVRVPGPIVRISVIAPASIALGSSVQLVADMRDADSVRLATPTPTFRSANPLVVDVSNAGLLTAVGQGSTTISIAVGDKTGSASIRVTEPDHAFLWSEADGMADLGVAPGFVASKAFAISAAGHVAGSMTNIGATTTRAVMWTPGTPRSARVLSSPFGGTRSEALAVNNLGRAVGYATNAAGRRRAIMWSVDGSIWDIGVLTGMDESVAQGINDAGQVVGWSRNANDIHAFIWSPSDGLRALGVWQRSAAYAINAGGEVVGMGDEFPVVLSSNSRQPLSLLYGDESGRGVGIADNGYAVGEALGCSDTINSTQYYYGCEQFTWSPMLWPSTSSALKVNRVGGLDVSFEQITGVNADRQVVGTRVDNLAQLYNSGAAPLGRVRLLGVLPNRTRSAASAINNAGQVVGWSGTP